MADEDQNQEISTRSVEKENDASQGSQNEEVASTEKLVKQSDVNRIVGSAKVDAFEKGKREALEQARQEAELQSNVIPPPASNSQGVSGITQEELDKRIEEAANTRAARQKADDLAMQFVNKIQTTANSKKYSDFEEVVTKLDMPNLPPRIIEFANNLDNTAEVMYEIGKNPSKLANVLMLTATSPRLAYDELVKLSDSIKKNEDAAQKNSAEIAEPLDQVKHSTTGKGDGSVQTVNDFRKQDWLRG